MTKWPGVPIASEPMKGSPRRGMGQSLGEVVKSPCERGVPAIHHCGGDCGRYEVETRGGRGRSYGSLFLRALER